MQEKCSPCMNFHKKENQIHKTNAVLISKDSVHFKFC